MTTEIDTLYSALGEAEAHAKELEARLAEREWRPIETAPRDGTRIMLWWGYFEPYMAPGRWNHVEGYDKVWEGWEDDTPHIPGNQECITHWMPLPEPPAT